ncbi:MAG: protein kinase [Actinomycetota bacterium]|nr:protein kinase [Actinomycetota bacterium]
MAVAPDLCGCALDDRYELHALIGEGAFGRVYRGHDRRLSRPIAVKVIKPWWSEDPDWVRRFEREAQLLARLDDPGIVRIFDVGHAAEGVYYVAELVEGESLAERLGRGALAPREACEIAEQLCVALAQAHAEGIVHRDVKPGNVLISAGGRVKVGDFGLALAADASTGGSGATIVGTPSYMAPEQAEGLRVTPATDVYSVGVVLYEMLVGSPPFTGGSPVELALRHVRDTPPPLPAAIPTAARSIVTRSLSKSPSERYADAGTMAEALASARVPREAGRSDETPWQRVPGKDTWVAPRLAPRANFNPPARRRAAALLASAVVLLLGMVAAAIATANGPQVRVPAVIGLTRAGAAARATAHGLHPAFVARFGRAPKGTAIAQAPSNGIEVGRGTTIRVVLSAGPPPVTLPRLAGESSADARATLQSLGLKVSIVQVVAPGQPPRTVTAQSPQAGSSVFPGSTVLLREAESPRWRPLLSLAGDAGGGSRPFRIRGSQWRVVYSVADHGICSWASAFCSNPSATIGQLGGASLGGFDLGAGSNQTQIVRSGPGDYQVSVSPGDNASWSMVVEDYY